MSSPESRTPAVAVRVLVTGNVQGVGFRYACERRARDAGVSGWVRNLATGQVEAMVEGPPDAVDQVVAWAREGPRQARVDRVEVEAADPLGLAGFTIR